jgi:hypothetical protein
MKISFSGFLMVLLTAVMLGQMTASTYVCTKDMCGMEMPVEEAADEDTDNEGELDKLFQSTVIENTDLSYSVSHHSFFKANLSELIEEIVPPPPKA